MSFSSYRPRVRLRRLAQIACAVLLAAGSPMAAVVGDKISPEIFSHQRTKIRPPSVDMRSHAARLLELGLDPTRLDSEKCAVYSVRRLRSVELRQLDEEGIAFNKGLWVPPVPGRHPYGFHLADVPYDKLDRLRSDARVVRVESAEHAALPASNLARQLTGVADAHAGNGIAPLSGAGVKLAIADSGIDLGHPDLPVPVESFDVTDGAALIEWSTDVSNTVIDHGTHVAGIAVASGALSAGNVGNGGADYAGSSPGVDFYFYKIGSDTTGSTTPSDQIEAIQRAGDVGCDIFSMSYGGWNTFNDGSSAVCQAIDVAVDSGMTVLTSSGNDADLGKHAAHRVSAAGASTGFGFTISNSGGGSAYTSTVRLRVIWRDDVPADGNVSLEALNLGLGESLVLDFADTSLRGTESALYFLNPVVAAGTSKSYELRFVNSATGGAMPLVHVYRIQGRGNFDDPDPSSTVIHPAICDGTLAVGAWTQRSAWVAYTGAEFNSVSLTSGTLGSFSGRGPRVDGRMKPQIVAPGAVTISTRDSVYSTLPARFIDDDGLALDGSGPANYYALSGTSMATPHAAGAAALLLEADGSLAPTGVLNILGATASAGADPDSDLGFGLLDVVAAVQALPDSGADLDGDGQPGAGVLVPDCDDGDPELWAVPGEVLNLRFVDPSTLIWTSPSQPGGPDLLYDVLRSATPDDFGAGAVCPASGERPDRWAVDENVPGGGALYFYLVRARNGCPGGPGSLGSNSQAVERAGADCP